MRIKLKYFVLLFLTIIVVRTKAQEKDIHGLVLVDFRNEYPEGVSITNQRNKTYAVTDISGSFHIKAQLGDTLLFKGDYLLDRTFVVKPSTYELNPFIVHMNYEVITLPDVVVRPPLTGDLEKDSRTVQIHNDVEKLYANLGIDIRALDIEPKERKEPIIPKIGPIPIPTSLNVEALYKTFTGYYRRMKNLNEFERLEKKFTQVKDYLGPTYFKETIGIEEGDIRGFLLYVHGHSDHQYESYYAQSDYLSMDTLLRQKAQEYKTRLKERETNLNK